MIACFSSVSTNQSISVGVSIVQVKIWFQNRRSKVKKMMKQHQHGGGGQVNNNAPAGGNGGAGGGASGGGLGQTAAGSGDAHGLPPAARDCWSQQPASSTHPHHPHHGTRRPDDDRSPPPPPHHRDVIDDDEEEPTKKPLHLLQLQTAMHRFSPDHHAGGGGGPQLKVGTVPSYRGGSPTAARYHHHHHAQHPGTPMASPIHAWPDDIGPPGLHQQQQRIHVSNQPSPYHSSAYMMTSPEMTSTYQWYAGSQQPTHHLPTLLS